MESVFIFGLLFVICIGYIQKNDRAYVNGNLKIKKQIVLVLTIALFLLGALRSPNTGVDTANYVAGFSIWRVGVSLSDLFQEAFSSFTSQRGFFILERLFYNIIPNAQIWLAFLCLLFLVPCAILIYRYSDCPPLSFIYLLAFPVYTFSWQALKQTVAMALCLFAFLCLFRKKRLLYFLLVFLAFQFHKSCIVVLFALPAMRLKVERWDFLLIAAAFLISVYAPATVKASISVLLDVYDRLEIYLGEDATRSTYTMFFIFVVLYLACYLVKGDLIRKNPFNKVLFNMSIVGIALQAMAVIVAEFFRVSLYFSMFNMLLVANAGQLAWEKYPKLHLRLFLAFFMIFIFFGLGGFDYWFFFQNRLV